MENNQIYIENIGIGLLNISNLFNLDLKLNEYLVVGQRDRVTSATTNTNDVEYNMIVNHNGVGINATREQMAQTNAGLLVNNNIICKGTIIANSIEFENFTFNSNITSNDLVSLVKQVNSNVLFFKGYDNTTSLIKTIYTPSYLTIGNFISTYYNQHPLKISDTPNGYLSNIQIAIYNKANTDTNEPVRFSMGILGLGQNSPANIVTSAGMPLEFHISKPIKQIDDLYSNALGIPEYNNETSNYPQLAIDNNGTININKNVCDVTFNYNNTQIKPRLFVNGAQYATDIFMYDRNLNTTLHLNDIFMLKTGITLNANQISGGMFSKTEFTFLSNVNIGTNNCNFILNVNDSAIIKNNLTTENLIAGKTIINGVAEFNRTSFFNNTTIFNSDISINKSLNITNDLFIGGYRVNVANLNTATAALNYDNQCNLSISGRLGTGIFPIDTYDHQFNIIKRRPERFEIYMNDMSGLTTDSSKVYIGHTTLNNLNGNFDNSLLFITQKNIKWHNFYFYPGKDISEIKRISPTLAIMENNKIGINTNLPNRTLDVIGDFIANDYFVRINNIECKMNYIYINQNNSSILNVNTLDINLIENLTYKNKKTLNITGGINSYDGFFEGENKVISFLNYNDYNINYINNNIGIGVIKTDNPYPIPLQIRNTNTTLNNNTIIRLYRGIRGGGLNNDSLYTGIDFCDYDVPIQSQNRNNYKWFIYKNHKNPQSVAGVLQLGFTNNSVTPTHSCMNFYYNDVTNKYFIDVNNEKVDFSYNNDTIMSIKGNVDIAGNVNLIGENSTYRINGVIIGSFSNPAIINQNNNNYYNFEGENTNDVGIVANKIGLLPNKAIVIGYNKDDWIYLKMNKIQSTYEENNDLSIFYNNKDYIDNNPPIVTKFYNKSFKNYSKRPDISIIEQGIVSTETDSGIITNKIDLKLKGYSDTTIYEITPNDSSPFITMINKGYKNQVNIGNKSFYYNNLVIYPTTAVHINDDFEYLLRLTNNSKPVKIAIANDSNIWNVTADSNLDVSYNNNSLIKISSNGAMTFNSFSNNSYIDYYTNNSIIFNSSINKGSIECTNYYYNDYKTSLDIGDGRRGFIESHYSNIETSINTSYFDSYDDNLDTTITKFIYTIKDSNLPLIDIDNKQLINYRLINSNYIHNNSIDINLKFNPKNLKLDYKFFDNIIIDSNNFTIKLIPSLYSYDTNVTAFIKTSNSIPFYYPIENFNFPLSYLLPKTSNLDDISINSFILSSNKISSINNSNFYNLNLRTILNLQNNFSTANYQIKTINTQFMYYNSELATSNFINTKNDIYYYPYVDIVMDEIEINLKYKYNFRNDINIPTNFFNNYTNNSSIISIQDSNVFINNSNSYLTNTINGTKSGLAISIIPSEIIYSNLSSDITEKLYQIELNSIQAVSVPINITKYNYFQIYKFDTNNCNIPLPIIVNNFQPHITLRNYINSKYSQSHKIYSYDNKYEIYLGSSKQFTLDSNANLSIGGSLSVKDLYFTGDIYSTTGNTLTSIYNALSGSNFYINKFNVSMNASNIFLNPSIYNKGGIIINKGDLTNNNSNNLFEINNYQNNNNFITLKSINDSGFINFFGTSNIYKIGSSNGNFGIWKTNDKTNLDSSYIENNLNNYSNVINFIYPTNSIFPIINLNGSIRTTSNLTINDTTFYPMNLSEPNYKVRVNGNMKVDGAVMSSSDIRIKTNINKIDSALTKICKLNGITYNNINNKSDKRETGLIAQEVKEILPEAVFEDDNGLLNIAYGNLMGLVIEAIKELKLLSK